MVIYKYLSFLSWVSVDFFDFKSIVIIVFGIYQDEYEQYQAFQVLLLLLLFYNYLLEYVFAYFRVEERYCFIRNLRPVEDDVITRLVSARKVFVYLRPFFSEFL